MGSKSWLDHCWRKVEKTNLFLKVQNNSKLLGGKISFEHKARDICLQFVHIFCVAFRNPYHLYKSQKDHKCARHHGKDWFWRRKFWMANSSLLNLFETSSRKKCECKRCDLEAIFSTYADLRENDLFRLVKLKKSYNAGRKDVMWTLMKVSLLCFCCEVLLLKQ